MMRCEGGSTFAVQYLEGDPEAAARSPVDVRARLRAASAVLPISMVLSVWNLPLALVDVGHEETDRTGAQLYLWHPLLTGDGMSVPQREWWSVGLDGVPLSGFRGAPEFTFVCSNRPSVRAAILQHLRDVVHTANYDGVFLDRIRYPSPAASPSSLLACFCDDCRLAAQHDGLDLRSLEGLIRKLAVGSDGASWVARMLLDPQAPVTGDPTLEALRDFLSFRARSITRIVEAATEVIRAEGLAVGLDSFSPALPHVVGQSLESFDPLCDWVKIMTYGHAVGPAGLPFELLDLSEWLIARGPASEAETLEWMSVATGLPLPPTRHSCAREGSLRWHWGSRQGVHAPLESVWC